MGSRKIVILKKVYVATSIIVLAALTSTVQANTGASVAVEQLQNCEPTLDWQGLSRILQARIEPLEAKGIENLTGDEFEFYAQLSDGLSAVKKLHTLQTTMLIMAEKKKQVEQKKTIAAEQAETAEIKKTGQKIMELEKVLSGEGLYRILLHG